MPATLAIAENLARVEDQIAAACRRAGRSRSELELMAVSKTHPVSALLDAIAAGLTLFGENRVQEFQQKRTDLAAVPVKLDRPPTQPRFHLIGHLQSNKATRAAEIFDSIDTVDSLRLAERLNEAAQKLGEAAQRPGILPILLEIKLSHEEAKAGIDPSDDPRALPELLERLPDLRHIQLRGLMTVPPWSEDPETARPYFARLRTMRDRLAAEYPRLDFSQLSIGMSGDFEVAIEEGSSCVRIGTALFGKRPKPA